METKYVCRGLISPYVNVDYNRTIWSTNLHVNFAGGGKRKKSRTMSTEKLLLKFAGGGKNKKGNI